MCSCCWVDVECGLLLLLLLLLVVVVVVVVVDVAVLAPANK
jgi:hypothetical protein